MNRLEQDAADSLAAYEFQQAERDRWARAQAQKVVSVWRPTISDKERAELSAMVAEGLLPF